MFKYNVNKEWNHLAHVWAPKSFILFLKMLVFWNWEIRDMTTLKKAKKRFFSAKQATQSSVTTVLFTESTQVKVVYKRIYTDNWQKLLSFVLYRYKRQCYTLFELFRRNKASGSTCLKNCFKNAKREMNSSSCYCF